MAWPVHFPASCPPSDAVPQDNEVYRVVFNNPPTLGDFSTLAIRAPHKLWPTDELKCQACGISVYENATSALSLLRRMDGGSVAKGKMSLSAGVSKKTGKRDHFTWWIYKDCEPNFQDFVVVSQP